MSTQVGSRLKTRIELIDPLLQQRSKDLRSGLQQQLAKCRLHLQQRGGQVGQPWLEHYLDFFGERLV